MSIQTLREQRQEAAKAARALIENVKPENWTSEHDGKYEKVKNEIDNLDKAIKREEEVLQAEAVENARIERRSESKGISKDEAAHNLSMGKIVLNKFLRGGVSNLNSDERSFMEARRIQNAMSTGTGSEGGYTTDKEFAADLQEEMKAFGGMRSVCRIIQTSNGSDINWPTVDETAQEGEIVGENVTVARQDITFGTKAIKAYKFSSKDIAVPFELLQDSQIDLESYIRKALAERIARSMNNFFTVGTGTSQPQGVVTASVQGKEGAGGQTTGVIYDDLVDLIHSVDPAYRQMGSCRFMFNDTTLKILKKLKDADGRPLWVPGVAMGEPDTILAQPYTINQHMADPAASARPILYGDFSKYIIRDVMAVELFRMTDSAFTRNGQVGFLAFARADGALISSSASCMKHFANPAA